MYFKLGPMLVSSVEELHEIAGFIALKLPLGGVVGLVGPLGAGKTEFVRGFMRALGGEDLVSSPSYVLENIYEIHADPATEYRAKALGVRHLDVYRLSPGCQVGELLDIASGERALTLIEWVDRLQGWENLVDVVLSFHFADSGEFNPSLRVVSLLSYSEVGDDLIRCVGQELACEEGMRARDE